ncbi:MAG: orotidine-5'-phosphate decarboxylase, partial [Bdellovibrionales bacterium]|nr:orotidine-5'-phosphate decarboxylase [Bdellovibrionales bacterium]
NAVKRLAAAGAGLITVHASAGEEALRRAVAAADGASILAITILTSFAEPAVQRIYRRAIPDAVTEFALLAAKVGVPGIVCSPQELSLLGERGELGHLLKVTPGVRPSWFDRAGDDQSRVLTPREAVEAGATHLVIGRPITGAADPQAAAERINEELAGC